MVGDDQVFGSASFRSAIDLPGARSSISQIAIAETQAVVIAAAEGLLKKKWPDFSKPASAPSSLVRRFM